MITVVGEVCFSLACAYMFEVNNLIGGGGGGGGGGGSRGDSYDRERHER